jgi:hypothetical protein
VKARWRELLDRALAAMVATIEVYNKPNFPYRAESFTILATNGWELLIKAKWLRDNKNDMRSLYVYEKEGSARRIKRTRTGNPFTHDLGYLARKLVEEKKLDQNAYKNLEAIVGLRDSAIHFYNPSPQFVKALQEISAATVKNFVAAAEDWFDLDFSEYNFCLIPLAFLTSSLVTEAIVLNKEESNFLTYLRNLENDQEASSSRYSTLLNIDIRFTKSKSKDVPEVRVTKNPDAPKIQITEEQIAELCFLQALFPKSCKPFFHSIASPFSTKLQAPFPHRN